jgi:hypothetical protein
VELAQTEAQAAAVAQAVPAATVQEIPVVTVEPDWRTQSQVQALLALVVVVVVPLLHRDQVALVAVVMLAQVRGRQAPQIQAVAVAE